MSDGNLTVWCSQASNVSGPSAACDNGTVEPKMEPSRNGSQNYWVAEGGASKTEATWGCVIDGDPIMFVLTRRCSGASVPHRVQRGVQRACTPSGSGGYWGSHE